MNKAIKELLVKEDGRLDINEYCSLMFFRKDVLGNDNNGKGWLHAYFNCQYGRACHSVQINSRDVNEIRMILQKEQSVFFNELTRILNNQIKGGKIA